MVCQACGYLRSFHQMALQVCVCCWQDISRVAAYSPVQAVVSLSASLPAHGILLWLSTQGCWDAIHHSAPTRMHSASCRSALSHASNNNNSHDNVYGAVIMTKVIARVHPVHLMNVDWAPGGRQPSDQARRLGLWVRRKLAAIIHIHHRHCYYYSARKLILILLSHEDEEWNAEST